MNLDLINSHYKNKTHIEIQGLINHLQMKVISL